MPLSSCWPRSSKASTEPATRSLTVLETSTSPGWALAAGMHGDAGHLPVHQLALARVQADTDFQSELGHLFRDGATAADGACRPVEGGEETVPRRVHLLTAEARPSHDPQLVTLSATT